MYRAKAKTTDDYQERIRGYERDKKLLREKMGHLSAADIEKALKSLADKWRI